MLGADKGHFYFWDKGVEVSENSQEDGTSPGVSIVAQ